MNLTIFRGLPGAGKSTLAHKFSLKTGTLIIEPDQFLIQDGKYVFTPEKCTNAHAVAQETLRQMYKWYIDCIYVATLPRLSNILDVTRICPVASITIIDCIIDKEISKSRNVHGVPSETIDKMNDIWEDFQEGVDLMFKRIKKKTPFEIEMECR